MPTLQENLRIFEDLTIRGLRRISHTGSEIGQIIRELNNENCGLGHEDQLTVQNFRNEWRSLIKDHKNYIYFHKEIRHFPLEQQIEFLHQPFDTLNEKMTTLHEAVHRFILDKGFEIQEGSLVSVPQQQEEIQEIHQEANPQSDTTSSASQSEIGEEDTESNAASQEEIQEIHQEANPQSDTTSSASQGEIGEGEIGEGEIGEGEIGEGEIGEGEIEEEDTESNAASIVSQSEQATGNVEGDAELTASEIETLRNQVDSSVSNNLEHQSLICQLTVPLNINVIEKLQSKKLSTLIGTIKPNLEFQYLKTATGQNQFLIGISWKLNSNYCSPKKSYSDKSNLLSLRSYNTIATLSRCHNTTNSYFTLSFGQVVKVRSEEISVFTNFALKNNRFKKENLSFQVDYTTPAKNIVSTHQFYLTGQSTISYEFFPFSTNVIMNTCNLPKKTSKLLDANETVDGNANRRMNLYDIKNDLSIALEKENLALPFGLRAKKVAENESLPKATSVASVSSAPEPYIRNLYSLEIYGGFLVVGFIVIKKIQFFLKNKLNNKNA